MKHKLKTVLFIGLALIALFGMTGCPNNAGGNGGTPPAPTPKHAVTFSVEGSPANGTLKAKADGIAETATSPINVEQGKTVTFTAAPDSGYRVKGWTLDGTAVNGTNDSYMLSITKAVNVKVSFERERIAITKVRAKTAPIVLGATLPYDISYTYTGYEPAGVVGEPAKFSWIYWQKKNGTQWENVSGSSCTPGTYRLTTQIRIDSPDSERYTLTPDIKVFVSFDDGNSYEEWSVSDIMYYPGYSFGRVTSKEYYASGGGSLTLSQSSVSVPKSYVGKQLTEVNVASLVSGGTPPYRFTLDSGALPAGLSLREDGVILGTPTAAQAGQAASIAQIKVRDSASPPAENVIDVFCTEGIVDKKLITFVVGWRATAPAPIEVDSGQPISLPSIVPVDSCWTVSGWCITENAAVWGTGPSGVWDFSQPVTDHMTLYARWSDNRTPITALTATMDAPAAGNPIPSSITYDYSAGSPAEFLNSGMYTWEVWNGTKWEDANGTFESGKKYRIKTQMRIELPGSKRYRLPATATDITVTVNGQSWTIGDDVYNHIDYDDSRSLYSMVWVTSPDFAL